MMDADQHVVFVLNVSVSLGSGVQLMYLPMYLFYVPYHFNQPLLLHDVCPFFHHLGWCMTR